MSQVPILSGEPIRTLAIISIVLVMTGLIIVHFLDMIDHMYPRPAWLMKIRKDFLFPLMTSSLLVALGAFGLVFISTMVVPMLVSVYVFLSTDFVLLVKAVSSATILVAFGWCVKWLLFDPHPSSTDDWSTPDHRDHCRCHCCKKHN